MTFLVKLITPPGGTVLDPFAGSGSTLVAAVNNGFRFIGIERDDEYIKIAKGRLDKAVHREVISQEQSDLFDELMGG
jgi:site-specific DNA-methyltransferase (adenine-specific)